MQEMMRRSLYHIKWYFARTDLNTDKGKAENKKSIVKYVKWYTPEKEQQYPTSFKVDFVGQPYEGACYYRITRCPICAYAEKLGVSRADAPVLRAGRGDDHAPARRFVQARRRSRAAGTTATTSSRATKRKSKSQVMHKVVVDRVLADLDIRVYLKTPNAPGQRTFSRCAAPFFLEIRQYSCEKMSCSAQKFLAAGHIGSFQIHPRTFDHVLQINDLLIARTRI